jgi:hypothetical protein
LISNVADLYRSCFNLHFLDFSSASLRGFGHDEECEDGSAANKVICKWDSGNLRETTHGIPRQTKSQTAFTAHFATMIGTTKLKQMAKRLQKARPQPLDRGFFVQ